MTSTEAGRSGMEELAGRWLRRRKEQRLLRRFGGIQTCPWCRQCAQAGEGEWHFKPWVADTSLDVLTCSVCTGTSIWLWGMGMHFMAALDPPKPAFEARIDPAAHLQNQGNPSTGKGGG
jgi:hypothetical protein